MNRTLFATALYLLLLLAVSHLPARAEGVVSYWAGEGNAQDSVGGNHGTIYGAVSFVPAVVGQGFSFNGGNTGIYLPDAPNLRLTRSLTITAWVKATAFPSDPAQNMILFRGDERGGNDPYYLGLHTNGSIQFHISNGPTDVNIFASFPLNIFVFVRASLDDATGRMSLYLNNVLVAETFTAVRPLQDLIEAYNPGVGIGAHSGGPNTPYPLNFIGVIDELTLYDTPEPTNNVSFSGRLTLQGGINQAQPVTFEFRPSDGSDPFTRTLTLNPDRSFRINEIPKGNYTVWIKSAKWLAKVVAADMSDHSVTGVSVTLKAGDANNDNIVDVEDLAAFISAFDADPSSPNWNGGVADFNTDDIVDQSDLDLFIRNFDAEGDA